MIYRNEKFINYCRKKIRSPSGIQPNDYFSSLFTKKTKGGSYVTILNLKFVNEEYYTKHS